jgi:hypothetical protein
MNSLHSIPPFVCVVTPFIDRYILLLKLIYFVMLCYLYRLFYVSCPFHAVTGNSRHSMWGGVGGGGIMEQQLRSTQITFQGTFWNSTTRLRVRVPLRKVCAIILVSFITMDLSRDRTKALSMRLGVHKFFKCAISKLLAPGG